MYAVKGKKIRVAKLGPKDCFFPNALERICWSNGFEDWHMRCLTFMNVFISEGL